MSLPGLIRFCEMFDESCDMTAVRTLFQAIDFLSDMIIGSNQLQLDVLRCLASLSLHFESEMKEDRTLATSWMKFKLELLTNADMQGSIGCLKQQYINLISGVLEDQPDPEIDSSSK